MLEIYAQIFGFIALVLVCISFQMKNNTKLLKIQIFSSILFALQYLFLVAMSGFFINIFTAIRNFVFSRYENKKIPIFVIVIYLSVIILFSYSSYTGVISLLPGAATLIYGLTLYSRKLRAIRIADIIACLIFIVYDISVGAYMGIISCIIEITSSIISLIRFRKKKNKRKK